MSYLSKMLYALTSAYTRKDYDSVTHGGNVETNIGKLFSIFAWGLDTVQEQADLILAWDNLDNARGKVLDRYGANFGVERGGASDALYRLFIRVKMIAQLSGGDEDAVLKAAAELLGVEYADIDSEDRWPAKKRYYVDQVLLDEERLELIEQITWAIKRTMAAGVGLRLYLRTYHTYVLPVDIKHGSVIIADYTALPVGIDRELDLPLDISHGARMYRDLSGFLFDPPGMREYGETVDISHGLHMAPALDAPPYGQDRIDFMPVDAALMAFDAPALIGPPQSKDRTGTIPVDASLGATLRPTATGPPAGEPRKRSEPLPVGYGAFDAPGIAGIPPDVETAHKGRESARGGAHYHTHIKPKRIE